MNGQTFDRKLAFTGLITLHFGPVRPRGKDQGFIRDGPRFSKSGGQVDRKYAVVVALYKYLPVHRGGVGHFRNVAADRQKEKLGFQKRGFKKICALILLFFREDHTF